MKRLAIVICAASVRLAEVAIGATEKSAHSVSNDEGIIAITAAKPEANPRIITEAYNLRTPRKTKRQFHHERSSDCVGVICTRQTRHKRFIGIGFPGFGGFWPGLFGGLSLFGGLGGLGGLGGFPGGYPAACCCCYS